MVFDEKILACAFGADLGHISLFGAYLGQFLKLSSQRHGCQDPSGIGRSLARSATFQDSLQTIGSKSIIQRVDQGNAQLRVCIRKQSISFPSQLPILCRPA